MFLFKFIGDLDHVHMLADDTSSSPPPPPPPPRCEVVLQIIIWFSATVHG